MSQWVTTLNKKELQGIKRLIVLGTTGVGKSTVAHRISAILEIPIVELDALKWQKNWASVSDEEFQKRVSLAISGEKWVVDGNYGILRDLIWPRSQAIIWLDYSFSRIFGQPIANL